MSFTTTGNISNHWTKEEALRVLKEENILTGEELKDLTGRELISLACGTIHNSKVLKLETIRRGRI